VLTQAREELIQKTVESLRGAPRRSCTCTTRRRWRNAAGLPLDRTVSSSSRSRTRSGAGSGGRLLPDSEVTYQYSPESSPRPRWSSRSSLDAVFDVWEARARAKGDRQPPSTVEYATPNVYADQIEWCGRQLERGTR